MAYKGNDQCLAKVAEDEPIFTLRAQDRTAPVIVREWARRASQQGMAMSKAAEALACADEMEAWQQKNPAKVKVPD